jgi:ComF family protein
MPFREALAGLVGVYRCFGCGEPGAALCARCEGRTQRPAASGKVPWVHTVVAAWEYDDAARALVLALKLEGRRDAAPPLVHAMAATVARSGLLGEAVTWVPGRPSDIRARGFDHAELLARLVAPRIGLRARSLLFRRGSPPDQSGLSAAQRRQNLIGAFEARPCNGRVIVVDDVITTGATARACAAALRAGGAEMVELLAACRKS